MKRLKRMLGLILSLMLLCTSLTAQAAVYNSLMEKMTHQFDLGSGIKGSLTLSMAGEAEWTKAISDLNGKTIQIRAIRSRPAVGNDFQIQLYAENGDQQIALTQLFGQLGDVWYFCSEAMPEVTLSLPVGMDLLDTLLGGSDVKRNPTVYSILYNLMTMKPAENGDVLSPMLEKLTADLEVWLSKFAINTSLVRDEKGAAVIAVDYCIPTAAIRQQILSMLAAVTTDEAFTNLLGTAMSAKQKELYLNQYLLYYYDDVLSKLPFEEDLSLSRSTTADGKVVSTELLLPLVVPGWHEAFLTSDGEQFNMVLNGDEKRIRLTIRKFEETEAGMSITGTLGIIPLDDEGIPAGEPFGVDFALSRTTAARTDDDFREYDTRMFEIELRQAEPVDGTAYAAFPETKISMTAEFSSKNANNSSTRLDLKAEGYVGEGSFVLDGTCKTTSDWVLLLPDTAGAQNVRTMEDENRSHYFGELVSNILTLMMTVPAAE